MLIVLTGGRLGTFFASHDTLSTQALKDSLVDVISPRSGTDDALGAAFDQVLTLYPDDPSVGSPYGTGNELFGLPPSYKRQAAIREFVYSSSSAFR
jgi:hypothetical protein